ncbi:MAG TPA: glycosyltransferase [Pirellulales bacterium]
MTRRIVQIIPTLDQGGAEKQLTLLASGLDRSEFDVHVIALTRSGPLAARLEAAGVPLTVIGKRWKIDPFAYRRLEAELRRLRPDLVQTWLFAANSYGRVAARRAGVKRIIAGERCVDPWKRWHELAIDRRLAQFTDRIVVNSSGVREFYVSRGLPAEKFTVIPNGIPPAPPATKSREESRAALRAELGLPQNAKLIALVGRLWPQKRVKDAIWATDLITFAGRECHVLVIGDGPQRDRLERYRMQVGVEKYVHFLGHRSDVPEVLAGCDLLWLTSEYEGMPNSIMEAMQAGLPVVATNIAGSADLVVEGETGFLVPVGDRQELASRTYRLFDDPDAATKLGAAGRARIAQEFSVAAMTNRFAELYRELLD